MGPGYWDLLDWMQVWARLGIAAVTRAPTAHGAEAARKRLRLRRQRRRRRTLPEPPYQTPRGAVGPHCPALRRWNPLLDSSQAPLRAAAPHIVLAPRLPLPKPPPPPPAAAACALVLSEMKGVLSEMKG